MYLAAALLADTLPCSCTSQAITHNGSTRASTAMQSHYCCDHLPSRAWRRPTLPRGPQCSPVAHKGLFLAFAGRHCYCYTCAVHAYFASLHQPPRPATISTLVPTMVELAASVATSARSKALREARAPPRLWPVVVMLRIVRPPRPLRESPYNMQRWVTTSYQHSCTDRSLMDHGLPR